MIGVSEVSIIIEEDAIIQEPILKAEDPTSFIQDLFQTEIFAKVLQHIDEKNSY